MDNSRRNFLKLSAATLLTSLLQTEAQAASMRDVNRIIQQQVNKLASKHRQLRILYPKGSLDNIQVVAKQFQEKFHVNMITKEASLDNITAEMLFNHLIAKDEFDIAVPPTFSIATLASANVIADLSGYVEQYEPKAFNASSLYRLGDQFLGRFYGYQTDGDTYMLFFNRRFLDNPSNQKRYEDRFQKKLALPTTWTELDQQIRFFSNPANNIYGGSLFRNKNYIAWEFWIRMHARGLYPVADDMTPLIDRDEAVEELEKMIHLNQYLSQDVQQNGLFENWQSFAEGNKYCNIGWGGTQKYLANLPKEKKFPMLYSPTLSYNAGQSLSSFNWGWNYVVSSNSQQKELAYLFTLFASTPAMSALSVAAAGGYFDPHRLEHYQDQSIINLYGQAFLAAHQTSLRNSIPDFYLNGQWQYAQALKQSVYMSSLGLVAPRQALQKTAQKWEKITKKIGRSNQISQWQALKKAYPATFKSQVK